MQLNGMPEVRATVEVSDARTRTIVVIFHHVNGLEGVIYVVGAADDLKCRNFPAAFALLEVDKRIGVGVAEARSDRIGIHRRAVERSQDRFRV